MVRVGGQWQRIEACNIIAAPKHVKGLLQPNGQEFMVQGYWN